MIFKNDFSIQDDRDHQVESGVIVFKGAEFVPGTDFSSTFFQSREVQSAQTSDEIGQLKNRLYNKTYKYIF